MGPTTSQRKEQKVEMSITNPDMKISLCILARYYILFPYEKGDQRFSDGHDLELRALFFGLYIQSIYNKILFVPSIHGE